MNVLIFGNYLSVGNSHNSPLYITLDTGFLYCCIVVVEINELYISGSIKSKRKDVPTEKGTFLQKREHSYKKGNIISFLSLGIFRFTINCFRHY